MSVVLNTNIASLMASNNLLTAQSALATSVQRLSSGLRINSAKDDAAGLGVANSLTEQINGANQGILNLNDAISMSQTAESAITAASDMAQRILTLATQGANGTLGTDQRSAIQNEMQDMISAINSISSRSTFSGNKLLSQLTTGSADSTVAYSMQISNSANDKLTLNANAFADIGTTTGSNVLVTPGANVNSNNATTVSLSLVSGGTTTALTVGGAQAANTIMFASGASYTVATAAQIAAGQNLYAASSSTSAKAADTLLVTSGAGANFYVATQNGAAYTLSNDINSANLISSNSATATSAFQTIQTDAASYITALTKQRSLLGAYDNQLNYTLSNITTLSSNLQAARSRVEDVDYASETAKLTKGQILQQAATAMLAQANQMPNVILTLLK
jgi:flagellin